MSNLSQSIFKISDDIRYVATYVDGKLNIEQRQDIVNASDSESDHYEELLVNPTLITLLKQRGNIDCGGLDYVIVRYGNFYQLIVATESGHVSIGIEQDANPMDYVESIKDTLSA